MAILTNNRQNVSVYRIDRSEIKPHAGTDRCAGRARAGRGGGDDERDERRVLLEAHEVVQERRHDAPHGLRDDDVAEPLETGEPERPRRGHHMMRPLNPSTHMAMPSQMMCLYHFLTNFSSEKSASS